MVQLRFTRRFSMAHRLLAERSSKCATPHGHNEFISITLDAKPDTHTDWGHSNHAVSFEQLKGPWHRFIDDSLDHAFQLGDEDPLIGYFQTHEPDILPRLLVIKGDPTTEAVAVALFYKLNAILRAFTPQFECLRLELEETPTNTVIIRPKDVTEHDFHFGDWCHRPDMSLNDLLPVHSWAALT
jgi:6-pyruvoyltetrahydropterin/6-carboxytetrahydropterin synthase